KSLREILANEKLAPAAGGTPHNLLFGLPLLIGMRQSVLSTRGASCVFRSRGDSNRSAARRIRTASVDMDGRRQRHTHSPLVRASSSADSSPKNAKIIAM